MTITSEQDILITTTIDSAPPSIDTIDAVNGPPCEQVLLGPTSPGSPSGPSEFEEVQDRLSQSLIVFASAN